MIDRRRERAVLASLCSFHLIARPQFFYNGASLWLRWDGYNPLAPNVPELRVRRVEICQDTYMDGRFPWGSNQDAALVHLARWVRTGKMPLTVEDWEHWCGPPVYFGNEKFLHAIKAVIYGGE